MTDTTCCPASAMTFDEIRRALPHAYPFVLVDRVESVQPGEHIVALKNVSGNEWMFPGHFPGDAVYPGVLLVEGMAQAAILLLKASRPEVRGRFLLATARVQFQSVVIPGDQVRISCEAVKLMDDAGVVDANAHVGARLAAKATLTFAVR
jgi:3-hydroxyacyl-[acyl-carrier-protein] dehydratase